MTPKEIHDDMGEIIAEDSPSFVSVKKWAEEFKPSMSNTKYDHLPGYSKTTTDEQVDVIGFGLQTSYC